MKECRQCGKEITNRFRSFCQDDCRILYQEQIRISKYPICRGCGILIQGNKHRKFCNQSCFARYNNSTRPPMSEAQRTKLSESLKRAVEKYPDKFKGGWNRGKKKLTTRKNICKVCSKEFEATKILKTCSKKCLGIDKRTRSDKLEKIRGRGHKGYYRGIHCDSTYELAFVIWAKDYGHKIERCKLRIPYKFNGYTKLYNPDFLLDGTIYEIKGYRNEFTSLKLEAAISQGIKIIVLGQREIQFYIKYVNATYKVNLGKDYSKFYELPN